MTGSIGQAWRPRLARIALVGAGLALLFVWRGTPAERTIVFEWGPAPELRQVDLTCSTELDEVSGARWTFSDPVPVRVSHRVSVSAPELQCELELGLGSRTLEITRRIELDAEEIEVQLAGALAESRTSGEP